MTSTTISGLSSVVRHAAYTLTGATADYDPLLRMIGNPRFVFIGEASHGTHEFYRERAEITKRLIQEQGLNAVAVEADWPDAYRVNCYVRGASDDKDADQALSGFKRFPTWMWRNTVVLEFVEWLREYNAGLPKNTPRVGFYGLDLYSMYTSIEAVLNFLERVDPEAARWARQRYACFEQFRQDSQAYGSAVTFGLSAGCQREAIDQLTALQRQAAEYARRDGRVAEDDFFYAEQNARLVKNAEEYYRNMFQDRVSSWNLRDRHMAETLEALVAHLDRQFGTSKVAVWEHNSHIGDARATELGDSGELNVGQLVRERHGRESFLIGFSTHHGTVTAASSWDGPAERKQVRRALPGSYESLFHETDVPRFMLMLRDRHDEAVEGLRDPRLERAIGVIYRPDTERVSHYFLARLPDQFDAVIHLDETRAVEPLERTAGWESGESPETYPFGV